MTQRISKEHLAEWADPDGKLNFNKLLTIYQITPVELATLLGVPNPTLIVAVRPALDTWPARYAMAILEARSAYDQGVVELITGRYGNNFFLFRVPRATSRKHGLNYFNGEACP